VTDVTGSAAAGRRATWAPLLRRLGLLLAAVGLLAASTPVAVAAQSLPDVIVMDLRLSDGSGIEATRDIRAARPQTRVLMLTSLRRRRGPAFWPVR
jgi:DNA-binding NarL/FixJ family response regulator